MAFLRVVTCLAVLGLMLFLAVLGSGNSFEQRHKYTCPRSLTITNARLHGGLGAGTFRRIGRSTDRDLCIQRCCERVSCDLLAWIGDHCYSVSCFSEDLCRPVRLPATEKGVTLLYIVARNENQDKLAQLRNIISTRQTDTILRDRRSTEETTANTQYSDNYSQQKKKVIRSLEEIEKKNTSIEIRDNVTVVVDETGSANDELDIPQSGYLGDDDSLASGSATTTSLIASINIIGEGNLEHENSEVLTSSAATIGEGDLEHENSEVLTSSAATGSLHDNKERASGVSGSSLRDASYQVGLEEGRLSGDSGSSSGSSGSDVTDESDNSGKQEEGSSLSPTYSKVRIEPKGSRVSNDFGSSFVSSGNDVSDEEQESSSGEDDVSGEGRNGSGIQDKQYHGPSQLLAKDSKNNKATSNGPQDSQSETLLQKLGQTGLKTKGEWLKHLALKVHRYGNENIDKLTIKIQFKKGDGDVDNALNAAKLSDAFKQKVHPSNDEENKLTVGATVSSPKHNGNTSDNLAHRTKQGNEIQQDKPVKQIDQGEPATQIHLPKLVNLVNQVRRIYLESRKQAKHTMQDHDLSRAKEMKLIEKAAMLLTKSFDQSDDSSNHGKIVAKNPAGQTENTTNATTSDPGEIRTNQTNLRNKEMQAIKFKADALLDALNTLRFGTKPSVVRNTSHFQYLKQCGMYVEAYNVSKTGASWNTHLFSPYSYLYEIPEHFSECKTEAWLNTTDMRGSVFLSFQVKSIKGNTMTNNARVCAKYCCNEPRCRAWTVRLQEAETRNCDKGSYCCWLKSAVPRLKPGVDNCTSGIVQRQFTKDPPVGMRSAVPLGGLGTGSFELHADGTFHEWTIENQSPGGSAKLNKGALDMALFGVRVETNNKSDAALLRTHPPQGYPGVKELFYSGAYPVSKLSVHGSITDHVAMDMYAYPAFHPRDPYRSSVPAVAFTLGVVNKHKSESVNVSFMFNLPLGYQDDTIRTGDNYGEVVFTRNILPADCARACARMPKCMAWTTNGPTSCLMKDKMPLHSWAYGIISGLKGDWTMNDKRSMLTHERPGFFAQSGSSTLYPVGGSDREASFAVAYDFDEIWNNFTKSGDAGSSKVDKAGLHGAASVKATLQPGESKTLTIIMSWYYPHRDMAKVHVGNFYNNYFNSSRDVALRMREELLESIHNIELWQEPLLLPTPPSRGRSADEKKVNKLPLWLQDMLLNSVSFWRSAFWTEDGRFRQWEAYDCNDIDTIHNDMQRIIPYILFYPEVVRHLLLSWSANQYSNGMMQEALTQGCLGSTGKLDYAGGRVMADTTALFVVEVYHYYQWTGDSKTLHHLWPNAKRAITWLIKDGTKGTGLPFRKATSYDLAGLDKYDHHAYDSMVYILALRAAKEMALKMNDRKFNVTVTAAYNRARWLVDRELWDVKKKYYRAWWDTEYGAADWIMSDSFYGQVWANTLGLGDLVPREKLKIHLENEVKYNDSPYGLRVISTDEPSMSLEDTSLVLSRNIPGCKSLENITKHNSIWMGADANWASLMLNLGSTPDIALRQAQKALDHWRTGLHDQWNIHGLMSSNGYGQDGLPWATSHYNFHLVMWHIPFAITGQQYSAPDLSLTFWPKYDIPFELPFFTPTASGLIKGSYSGSGADEEEMFTFKVSSGTIRLKRLGVMGSYYGQGEIDLRQGSQVTWSRPRGSVASILSELK